MCEFENKVMETDEWKKLHQPHLDTIMNFVVKPFDGPHDWHWLICPCGAKHLSSKPAIEIRKE